MDQQSKLRPRKNQPLSKVGKTPNTRSPAGDNTQKSAPNLNEHSTANAATPAPLVQPETDDIVSEDDDNGNGIPDIETSSVDGAAASDVPDETNDLHAPHLPATLETYFKQATEKFEKMIRTAVESFIHKLNDLEANIGASLEYERKRIDDLQAKQDNMERKINDMQIEMYRLKSEVEMHAIAANRNERFSRRNNVRLVGIPEPREGERDDCIKTAESILRDKFHINSKVERAHRDGKRNEGKPRHILVKLLSYRDKVDVMRRSRDTLKNERFFITDDLTPLDLKEKQKWIKQVQELYRAGTKLRFFAGKWRQLGGNPYKFE